MKIYFGKSNSTHNEFITIPEMNLTIINRGAFSDKRKNKHLAFELAKTNDQKVSLISSEEALSYNWVLRSLSVMEVVKIKWN